MVSKNLPSILILAYKYPPYNLVGSNRWKNLSLNLAELGHKVHVVTAKWKMEGSIPSHKNLTVHQISAGILGDLKYRPLGKLTHLLRQAVFKYLFNPLLIKPGEDEASSWCLHAQKHAEKLIRELNLQVLIATGAPFSANYTSAIIKTRNPQIFLIQDFRDPWTKNAYDKNAQSSASKEAFAINQADAVISVTEKLLREFLEFNQDLPRLTVQNGYDSKLIQTVEIAQPLFKEDFVVLTHSGNVSNGREEPLKNLLETIASSEVYKKRFKIVIIGTMDQKARKVIHEHIRKHGEANIKTFPRMPQEKALAILRSSNFALQLNGPKSSSQVSTKIYEYAGLGVPTLSLNYGGEIDKLMNEFSLGISVNIPNGELSEALNNLPQRLEISSNLSQMSFDHQASLLSDFICFHSAKDN